MAQVSIIQYAEITTGTGRPIRFGSKDVPSVITLTGTGDVVHRVYNDLPALAITTLYDDEDAALKWFAIKSSVAAMLGFEDLSVGGTNAIKLVPNVWQFINSGVTTQAVGLTSERVDETEYNIETVKVYHDTGTADIEFVTAF
mgnify:CR=1 FL=1